MVERNKEREAKTKEEISQQMKAITAMLEKKDKCSREEVEKAKCCKHSVQKMERNNDKSRQKRKAQI